MIIVVVSHRKGVAHIGCVCGGDVVQGEKNILQERIRDQFTLTMWTKKISLTGVITDLLDTFRTEVRICGYINKFQLEKHVERYRVVHLRVISWMTMRLELICSVCDNWFTNVDWSKRSGWISNEISIEITSGAGQLATINWHQYSAPWVNTWDPFVPMVNIHGSLKTIEALPM
jgi:hypothetical protein